MEMTEWEYGDPWYENPKYKSMWIFLAGMIIPIIILLGFIFPYGF